MKRKVCPMLVQSDTRLSWTIQGEQYTRTYLHECVGEKCAAYEKQSGFCYKFNSIVILKKEEE